MPAQVAAAQWLARTAQGTREPRRRTEEIRWPIIAGPWRRAPQWSSTTGRSRAALAALSRLPPERSARPAVLRRRRLGPRDRARGGDAHAGAAAAARGAGACPRSTADARSGREPAAAQAEPPAPGCRGGRDRPAGRPVRRPAVRAVQGACHACGRARLEERRAAGRSCPCSGWPPTTTTSPRCGRSRCWRRREQLRTLRYAPAREPSGRPASLIMLDEKRGRPGGRAARACSRRACTATTMLASSRDCYRAGADAAPARSRASCRGCCPSLVVLDPSDPELKAADGAGHGPRDRRGLAHARSSRQQAGRALLAAGYHQQVPVRPGFLNLFLLMGGERRALSLATARWRCAAWSGGPASPRPRRDAARAIRAPGAPARCCARWRRT